MDAAIYILSTNLHWYKSETYKDVSPEEYQQIEAYREEYQGQVKVEYS